jgi:hypothetical protein
MSETVLQTLNSGFLLKSRSQLQAALLSPDGPGNSRGQRICVHTRGVRCLSVRAVACGSSTTTSRKPDVSNKLSRHFGPALFGPASSKFSTLSNRRPSVASSNSRLKGGSFTEIGHRQFEVSRHFGVAVFASDLFDCVALCVGSLLDQQLLIAALDPGLAAKLKKRLQSAVLQRVENIVGDSAGHRVALAIDYNGTLLREAAHSMSIEVKAKGR